jgi:ABC-type transport system involved in cytochrome c biogenesis permease subunit
MKIALVALCLTLAAGSFPAQEAPRRTAPWDPEVVDLFRTLAVQEAGRVKPLDTAVSFLLLRICGKRSATTPDGEKLSPMEWALDCMFYPEQAANYRVFQIQTSDVLDALELSDGKLMAALGLTSIKELDDLGLSQRVRKKRDRYPYAALATVRDRLFELGRRFSAIELKDRDVVEGQIVNLLHGFIEYELLTHSLDFARARFAVGDIGELRGALGGGTEARFSRLLAIAGPLREVAMGAPHGGAGGAPQEAANALLRRMNELAESSRYLSWFPPSDLDQEEWLNLPQLFLAALMPGLGSISHLEPQIAALARFEALTDDLADPAAFADQARALNSGLASLAEARGEYAKIGLEVAYYKADYFYKSLIGYLVSFVLVALSWLFLRSRVVNVLAWISVLASTGLLVTGIVMRCILRSRPPVSTLYETILFITAVVVIVALVIEAIGRRRIALSLAAALGALGMYLAFSHETGDGQDTMPQLVAVLDTNFWLATHVTSVTIGYAAGLLAGFIAHIYLLGRLFGFRRDDRAWYRNIARMVYGVLCFALLFSVVGTILGGIWANDSWGRFWGWDPKENGALMICLWQLLILHGRMGGIFGNYGICQAAVFGNMVVAFSWWHVNLLGVGLHSYGFTAGVQQALYGFYGSQILVMLLGALGWQLNRVRQNALAEARALERADSPS